MIARALVAAALALGATGTPASAPGQVVFRLHDARLAEVSGIAVGLASPGVAYVHNDSGDEARFFALDARSGALLATYTLPGATNVDWEDIAVARDARGVASVWLADIGDNRQERSEIALYRVDEPRVDRSARDVERATSAPDVWRLRYPDGAQDAESLAVAPGGAAYVVTKSLVGFSTVYAAPARPDPSTVHDLRRVASMRFTMTGTDGPMGPIGQLAATGAALSADGDHLVVRTYSDAYVWSVRGGDVAKALASTPTRIALPQQPQGEGIAVDGARLLIDSEQVGSPVFVLPLPAAASPSPSSSPSPSQPAGGSGSDVVPSSDLPTVTTTPGPSGPSWWVIGVVVLAGLLVLVITPFLDIEILNVLKGRSRRRRDV